MRDPVRRIFLFAFIQLIFLSACGGGGDLLGGGSGTSGSGGTQSIAPVGANATALTVDGGPSGVGSDTTFNTPYVSVTICAPGSTTNCQTIDHIEVDTGSFGLRIISSVINSSVLATLPQEVTSSNVAIAECVAFADGSFIWGSMRTADMTIAEEKAASLPIQVIGDPNYANIPADCSGTGTNEDTVPAFGANGILGVGPRVQDCGTGCTNTVDNGDYYSCPPAQGTCGPTEVLLSQEGSNPVASFTTDNNGVILELPAVPDQGASTVTGALVFGIGTESNNALGSATVLPMSTDFVVSIVYKGTTFSEGYFDSGSNYLFLTDNSLPVCGTSPRQYYCPSTQQNVSATVEATNGTQSTVNFSIADINTLLTNNPSFTALDNVAAPSGDPSNETFDFGLPFFYGRNVFTAIEGANTSGGVGPYFAY
jgi:hypothetical protein